ncbi:microcystin-dependent protein [Sphingomonas sp. UYAg733]
MSDYFLGEIRIFAGSFAPRGWHFCDGSLQSIASNSALYALLGTAYGGDGVNTFALPDLRGRVPVHQGTGPGLTARVMGQKAGQETVALTAAELPAHTHAAFASTTPATLAGPANAVAGTVNPTATSYSFYVNTVGTSAVTLTPLAATSVTSAGNGQPHDNLMPTVTLSYIIALDGIFPSRN